MIFQMIGDLGKVAQETEAPRGTPTPGIGAMGVFGIGAGIAGVFALWGVIKTWMSYASSLVIWRTTVSDNGGAALRWWLTNHDKGGLQLTSFCRYDGTRTKNYKTDKHFTALVEQTPFGGKLKIINRTIVWIAKTDTSNEVVSKNTSGSSSDLMTIVSIRGTFNADEFLKKVCVEFDKYIAEGHTENNKSYGRYYFRRCIGSRGSSSGGDVDSLSEGSSRKTDAGETNWALGNRRINFDIDDIQPPKDECKDVSFCPTHHVLFEDAGWWAKNEKWYKDRGISWRRGYCLHGKPGTGKTRMVRMLAQKLGLPVYSIDLSTFNNRGFSNQWDNIVGQAPAIILIEDFDAVFDKRVNKTDTNDDKGVTFDCLLSHLDGIEQNNGILVFITTNDISCLDEAIAANGVPTRPGRIDICLEMLPMNIAAIRQVAEKIVVEPVLVDAIVERGQKAESIGNPWTIAKCIEACTEQAMALAKVASGAIKVVNVNPQEKDVA
jgi:chaperone BCS1